MTLQEFINKYLGKQVEFHSFGTGALNQCVDLVNQYIKEVLGLTPIIGTNAKDFGTKYNTDEFTWIVNTPDAVIEEGDIPVWNGKVGGGAGHIAIATKKGTLDSFTSLDQNWSKVERVTLENHNYLNVLGWLRPKKTIIADDIDSVRKERDRNWELYQQALTERDQEREERNNNWNLYQNEVQKNTELATRAADLETKYLKELQENTLLKEDFEKLSNSDKDYAIKQLESEKEAKALRAELDELYVALGVVKKEDAIKAIKGLKGELKEHTEEEVKTLEGLADAAIEKTVEKALKKTPKKTIIQWILSLFKK